MKAEEFYRYIDLVIEGLKKNTFEEKPVRPEAAREAMIEIMKLWSEPKWKRGFDKTPQTIDTGKIKAILRAA